MIGKNTVVLNPATVQVALQDYFDKTYAPGAEQKILSVKVGSDLGYNAKGLEGLVVEFQNARDVEVPVLPELPPGG
jgi:hypothetical protein